MNRIKVGKRLFFMVLSHFFFIWRNVPNSSIFLVSLLRAWYSLLNGHIFIKMNKELCRQLTHLRQTKFFIAPKQTRRDFTLLNDTLGTWEHKENNNKQTNHLSSSCEEESGFTTTNQRQTRHRASLPSWWAGISSSSWLLHRESSCESRPTCSFL